MLQHHGLEIMNSSHVQFFVRLAEQGVISPDQVDTFIVK
jgi:hypothetical protein